VSDSKKNKWVNLESFRKFVNRGPTPSTSVKIICQKPKDPPPSGVSTTVLLWLRLEALSKYLNHSVVRLHGNVEVGFQMEVGQFAQYSGLSGVLFLHIFKIV
jgi:hypothetical protein